MFLSGYCPFSMFLKEMASKALVVIFSQRIGLRVPQSGFWDNQLMGVTVLGQGCACCAYHCCVNQGTDRIFGKNKFNPEMKTREMRLSFCHSTLS